MLIIRSPFMRQPEREYIFKVIFEEFLGIPYKVEFENRVDIEVVNEQSSGTKLIISDIFLRTNELQWLQKSSLPKSPLSTFAHRLFGMVPVIFGEKNSGGTYFEKEPQAIYCGLDIFGSAFFMLTRYEECVITERDQRNRFLARYSIAYQENFLDRPIVNEYIEILWELLMDLWPKELHRRPREFRFLLSHDVDWPFYVVGKTTLQMLKEITADVIKRGSYHSAYKKLKTLWKTRGGNLSEDIFNTFHWIMEQSEKAGIRSAFYFITQETAPGLDGNYSMKDTEIKRLLNEIHNRGHEIGLHPSYHTYKEPDRIKQQFDILLDTARANQIKQSIWGGRQHYLRWDASETWQYWEDAGLDYDSTLSYSDLPGFRCGVCYEYSVFNLLTRKQLRLKERPLIVMEQTVIFASGLGLKGREACEEIEHYYNQCRRFNGDFTLLWHNSQLVKEEEVSLYQDCIGLLQTN
ncbi:polysaccharide deacetylase family protein [Paenibacillus aestuarii]|nr:polysaccharide deacetylase family protein [Paenibacillus aestuarii]